MEAGSLPRRSAEAHANGALNSIDRVQLMPVLLNQTEVSLPRFLAPCPSGRMFLSSDPRGEFFRIA
jgi:hypothetical protein